MLEFKSPEDLSTLSPDDPAYSTVKELIEQLITAYSPPGRAYDAEDDGYIILIEPEDAYRKLDELWDGWVTTPARRRRLYLHFALRFKLM